jgi:response regulator RpfG family c-di-GMP phosphodiesterase
MKKKRTALLIDDCSIDNFINRKMIMNYDFASEVTEFQNPLKAIEHLRLLNDPAQFPDFIFLDLNMPVMSGEEFLAEYTKLRPDLKVKCRLIVLSGGFDPALNTSFSLNRYILAAINKPLIKMNLDYLESLLASSRHRSLFLSEFSN